LCFFLEILKFRSCFRLLKNPFYIPKIDIGFKALLCGCGADSDARGDGATCGADTVCGMVGFCALGFGFAVDLT
jgi:hypothetical protein